MYKYSKKAEERYLSNPCEAFILYKFAQSESGQEYIHNKLEKIDANESPEKAEIRRNKQLDQIKQMCDEALKNLTIKFDQDVLNWIRANQESIFQKDIKF